MSSKPVSSFVMVVELGGMDVASGPGTRTSCVYDSNSLGGEMSTLICELEGVGEEMLSSGRRLIS